MYIFLECARHVCEHSKQQFVRKVSMDRDEMEIVELAFKSIRTRVKHKGEKHERESAEMKQRRARFVPIAESPVNAVRYEIA